MGIAVVTELVAIVDHLSQQARMAKRFLANDEERRRGVQPFQLGEDLRRPSLVRAVVESERHLFRRGAGAVDDERGGQADVTLADDRARAVEGNGTLSRLRRSRNPQDLATALDIPKSAIELVSGETSRIKLLAIAGNGPALAARLDGLA